MKDNFLYYDSTPKPQNSTDAEASTVNNFKKIQDWLVASTGVGLTKINFCFGYRYSNKYNLHFNDAETHAAVLYEMELYKQFGGGAVVENSNHGLQRNVRFLKEVSQRTGIHVIAGTGRNDADFHYLLDYEMAFIIVICAVYWAFPAFLFHVTWLIFCSEETNHMPFDSAQQWNYWCSLLKLIPQYKILLEQLTVIHLLKKFSYPVECESTLPHLPCSDSFSQTFYYNINFNIIFSAVLGFSKLLLLELSKPKLWMYLLSLLCMFHSSKPTWFNLFTPFFKALTTPQRGDGTGGICIFN